MRSRPRARARVQSKNVLDSRTPPFKILDTPLVRVLSPLVIKLQRAYEQQIDGNCQIIGK